ncbi:hypothetical protein ACFO0E_11390 [Chromohalobacter beijerinckii]|uniref:Uncharacterized protein n=1 Tax=Chromohalobacter beijerinckii TaxID=86179 RepID=A0ABV8XHG8_9GAMM|nr:MULTISPECIES: hypothetical protein [Chromohalobacter]MCK0764678.1 hypothetical protein [Chromohalobacter beijerinckii]MCK2041525.1 hypothetical protein [Chromohalobacter moromii]MCT8513673.1 hypothetical protein [Chromohalobacter sp. TMW 2.2271]CDQ33509.1 hypothetical protein BN993_02952 [Virgibacillus halodenitrificans]
MTHSPQPPEVSFGFKAILLRALCYILIVAGIMQLVMLDAQSGVGQFSETSLTELTQSALLLLSSLLMAYLYRHPNAIPHVSLLLGAFLFASFVRENDAWLDIYVFDGAWQVIVTLIVLPTLYVVIRHRHAFAEEFKSISNSLGFGMFAAGFLTTYVFSRLYGRSAFWEAMLGDHYRRVIKDAAEEVTELAGYMLLFFACIELVLLVRRRFNHHG